MGKLVNLYCFFTSIIQFSKYCTCQEHFYSMLLAKALAWFLFSHFFPDLCVCFSVILFVFQLRYLWNWLQMSYDTVCLCYYMQYLYNLLKQTYTDLALPQLLDFDGSKFIIATHFTKHFSKVILCFSFSFGFNFVQCSGEKCSKYLFSACCSFEPINSHFEMFIFCYFHIKITLKNILNTVNPLSQGIFCFFLILGTSWVTFYYGYIFHTPVNCSLMKLNYTHYPQDFSILTASSARVAY